MKKVNIVMLGRPDNKKQLRYDLRTYLTKIEYVDTNADITINADNFNILSELIEKIETKYKQLNNLRPI